MTKPNLAPETIAAQAAQIVDEATGAVVPALQLSTTYARDADYKFRSPNDYVRQGNVTIAQAEDVLAKLERGHAALLFSSGMAAITTLFDTIPQGAHVVAQAQMYYNTREWLQRLEAKGRIALTLFDAGDHAGMARAMQPGKTNLVWIETPSNPNWTVTSIAEAARIAHDGGAVLCVDATTLGAVAAQPLSLGADYVFHSATKYLNGHSDVLAGALVVAAPSARWDELRFLRTKLGNPLAPFDAWLLMRGMRTLFVRYRQCSANALAIALEFEKHPAISKVLYPGLPSDPGHAIAAREMTGGYGGMLSLVLNTDFNGARDFCTRLKLIVPATSLGGVESLAEHRKTVEGAASPVADSLVRFSIGIENAGDLIGDIAQALEGVAVKNQPPA
jgi:cystathionine gamma-synthase